MWDTILRMKFDLSYYYVCRHCFWRFCCYYYYYCFCRRPTKLKGTSERKKAEITNKIEWMTERERERARKEWIATQNLLWFNSFIRILVRVKRPSFLTPILSLFLSLCFVVAVVPPISVCSVVYGCRSSWYSLRRKHICFIILLRFASLLSYHWPKHSIHCIWCAIYDAE